MEIIIYLLVLVVVVTLVRTYIDFEKTNKINVFYALAGNAKDKLLATGVDSYNLLKACRLYDLSKEYFDVSKFCIIKADGKSLNGITEISNGDILICQYILNYDDIIPNIPKSHCEIKYIPTFSIENLKEGDIVALTINKKGEENNGKIKLRKFVKIENGKVYSQTRKNGKVVFSTHDIEQLFAVKIKILSERKRKPFINKKDAA